MKKILMMLAAATFAFAACEKPNTDDPTPEPGEKCEVCGEDPCVCGSDTELHLTLDVQLQHEVNTVDYSGVTVTLDSEKVLNFFEMSSADEFYQGMGYLDGNAQYDNTLLFGLCYMDGGEYVYEFVPQTSSNFGHWLTPDGMYTNWGENSLFFTESQCWWWGEGSLDAAVAAAEADGESFDPASLWKFTLGVHPGFYTDLGVKVGDEFKATEFIFQQSSQKTLYLDWNVKIVDAILRDIKAVETKEVAMEVEYDATYKAFAVEADYAAIASKLGVSDLFGECDIYPVNADGSYAKAATVSAWFGADGNVSGWGDNAVMCLELNSEGTGFSMFCMPYGAEQTAADKCGTFTSKMAIVAPNDNAVILSVTATINEPEAIDYEVVGTYDVKFARTYNAEYAPYFIAEIDYAAISTALGVENVVTDATMYPVNAEGVMAGIPSSDNWYGADGNISGWGENAIFSVKYEPYGEDETGSWGSDTQLASYCMPFGEGQAAADKCGEYKASFAWVVEAKVAIVNLTATISE